MPFPTSQNLFGFTTTDNIVFKAYETGLYLVAYSLHTAASQAMTSAVRLNGQSVNAGSIAASVNPAAFLSLSCFIPISAGDTIELVVSASASAITLLSGDATSLCAVRLT